MTACEECGCDPYKESSVSHSCDNPSCPAACSPVTEEEYQDLLSSIWLYISWRYVTKQLTGRQKQVFANAVDASSKRLAKDEGPEFGDPSTSDRWWQE